MTEETSSPQPAAAAPGLSAAEEGASRILIKAIHQELVLAKKAWKDLNEGDQSRSLDRIAEAVDEAVRFVVTKISAEGFPFVRAQLESLTLKDKAKAVLTVPPRGDSMHMVAERVGTHVTIVFADAGEHTQGTRDAVSAAPDQPGLALEQKPEAEAPAAESQPDVQDLEERDQDEQEQEDAEDND